MNLTDLIPGKGTFCRIPNEVAEIGRPNLQVRMVLPFGRVALRGFARGEGVPGCGGVLCTLNAGSTGIQFMEIHQPDQAWWHMPVIKAAQEDKTGDRKLEAIACNSVRSCLKK